MEESDNKHLKFLSRLILVALVVILGVGILLEPRQRPYNAFREAIISGEYNMSTSTFYPPQNANYRISNDLLESIDSSMFITSQTLGSLMEETTIIYAWVTGFNSIIEQTDSTPCLGAGGHICGRKQVVACPRSIELGTWVKIDGKYYECMDRLATKYDDRFDIFFDKDLQGALNYGKQYKEITIY